MLAPRGRGPGTIKRVFSIFYFSWKTILNTIHDLSAWLKYGLNPPEGKQIRSYIRNRILNNTTKRCLNLLEYIPTNTSESKLLQGGREHWAVHYTSPKVS